MTTLSMMPSLCIRLQFRSLHLQRPRLDRFSRESLRNRIHKQEVKESFKLQTLKPSPANETIYADSIPLRPISDLLKALGFTLGVSAGAYAIAFHVDWVKQKELIQKHAATWSTGFFRKEQSLQQSRDGLTPGEKCAVALLAANAVVTALWRVKGLHPFLWRYFSNSYASKALCSPMVLSVFSHSSVIHYGLNMYVLWTFAHLAVDKFLGPEQFWAFYLSAGVVSSFTSIVHKAAIRSPIRALGASGAIFGLLTYTCMKIPDARLKIVFLPFFDFSAENAVIGLILFDLAGLLLGWRIFDHAAHLGGALFGVAYATWGEKFVWGCCRKHYDKLMSKGEQQ